MKYIRTKDGRIIKIGDKTDIGYEKGTVEIHNKAGIVASYEPIEVLKIADTIEELCDKYIVKGTDLYTNMSAYTTLNYCPNKEQLIIHPTHKIEIYGAIWTDKGLIYVAKINKKGKLELL